MLSTKVAGELGAIFQTNNLSNMPDFKNYSLDELKDVEQNINQDLYPERYNRITKELSNRGVQVLSPEPIKQVLDDVEDVDEEVKPPPSKKKRITWILSSTLLVIFFLLAGEIIGRNGDSLTPENDPILYWSVIAFGICNVLYNVYKVLFSYDKVK